MLTSTLGKDILKKGLLMDGQARVYAISGREMVETARILHQASATCTAALGRTLMGTAMLGSMEKNATDEVSVIIKGGGPAGSIVCVGRPNATVKGYIADPHIELPKKVNGKLDVGGVVGNQGSITVIRDLGMKEPYVGRADLISGEIAEDFGAYFAYSQQQPSLVYLGVHISQDFNVVAASGLIVQPLPDCSQECVKKIEDSAQEIFNLTQLLKEGCTLGEGVEISLRNLSVAWIEQSSTGFVCDCSQARLEGVLVALGEDELRDMIEKDKGAELTCRFCQKQYRFDQGELERILSHALGG